MIKVGVIGFGKRISHVIYTCLKACEPDLRVVGIVDPAKSDLLDKPGERQVIPEEEREGIRFFDNVEEMMKGAKPDVVAIGTRCNLHAHYAIEMAKYNVPLYIEKPIATSMEQALGIERAFEKYRAPVMISFPFRGVPLVLRFQEMLSAGAVGRVEYILGVNYVSRGNVYFDRWYRDYQITQGLFLQKATHDLDCMSMLACAPVVRVAAMLSQGRVFRDTKTRPPGEPRGGPPAEGALGELAPDQSSVYYENIGTPETGMNEDSSSALLDFGNGTHGVYTQLFFCKGDTRTRGSTVAGGRGTISFDLWKNEIKQYRNFPPSSETISMADAGKHHGGDAGLAENFVDVLHGRAKTISPLAAGLRSVYTCLAAKESAATGRFVEVKQLGEAFLENTLMCESKFSPLGFRREWEAGV